MSSNGTMFPIDESKFREGQRGAYNMIIERFAAGEKFSAIVLTTRYGKTDVARMATLRLWRDGFTKSGLLIVPSRVLVEQSLDLGKFHACLSRYQVPPEVENSIRTYRVEGPPRPTRLKTALLSAMTAQMATRHIGTLERWVESCVNGEHPHTPLVVMDEAHMQSEDNTWGEAATRLADAGAHVVLMTATPYRSDISSYRDLNMTQWAQTSLVGAFTKCVHTGERRYKMLLLNPYHRSVKWRINRSGSLDCWRMLAQGKFFAGISESWTKPI